MSVLPSPIARQVSLMLSASQTDFASSLIDLDGFSSYLSSGSLFEECSLSHLEPLSVPASSSFFARTGVCLLDFVRGRV